jgi:raffinose/stachyose/melibiose transport system substrate-binding protein
MRTRHLLALAVATACLATACLATAACSSGVNSSANTATTLRVSATASDRPAMEAVIAAFKKQNPTVSVKADYLDTEPMQAAMRTQLSAGTAWDVMFVWAGNGNPGALQVLQPYGYLMDLSDQPWAARMPDGLKPVTQVGGKTYLLPMAFSGIGAVYNQTALQAVGVQAPDTWTQLLAFCDAARARGKSAFTLGNQTNWVTQLIDYALVATTVYATTPDFDSRMRAGTAHFVGSGWQTAMDKYLQMNTRGCFQKDPNGTSVDATVTQVARGDAVALVQGTWEIGDIRKAAPAGTQLVMRALPATDDPSQTRMPGAVSGTFAVNAKTKHKDLALRLLTFMSQTGTMNLWATTGGSLPAFPNDAFTAGPELASFIDYQKSGKTVPFMDQLWPNPTVQATHLTGVQDLFSGKSKPADVLAQMDAAYQKKS